MAAPYERLKVATEDEWHGIRSLGIGGSDAAVVAGISPFKSPLRLWMEKTGAVQQEDLSGIQRVQWGSILEGPVADYYAEQNQAKVRRVNAVLRSKEHPFMLASLDRTVKHPGSDAHPAGVGGLEVKTTGVFSADGWETEPPDYYQIQVQHYLAVTGFDWFDVPVLIGGQEYRQFTVQRDQELIDALTDVERKFWSLVQGGIMPDLEGHPDEGSALLALYPNIRKEEVLDLSGAEALAYVEQYLEGQQQKKTAEALMDTAKANLKAMLAESGKGKVGNVTVSWSRFPRKSVDVKGLTAAHPALVAQFTTETPSERFTVTPGKADKGNGKVV